jgi:hypothetical protein
MHKQELINKYTDRLNGVLNLGAIQIFSDLINDLKKLDGPEKVTIPQLIAEKIEYCKETDGYSLFHAMDYCYNFKECADWLESNEEVFARAWLDGYEIQGRKYVVTDGNHLYFKNYQEDIEIVILVDEQPGTMEYVKKFNTKEEAQKAADILGWKVQEVE